MPTALHMEIRDLRSLDWPEVAAIFADGIRTGNATFETAAPSWEEWDGAHTEIRLLAGLDGRAAGWAALSATSDRCCYAGVAENSVYVAESARGAGFGRLLLERLIASTESAGIWTIQSGIFPENDASLRLHEHVGFRVVGRRARLGKLHGTWRDVLFVERRSEAIE